MESLKERVKRLIEEGSLPEGFEIEPIELPDGSEIDPETATFEDLLYASRRWERRLEQLQRERRDFVAFMDLVRPEFEKDPSITAGEAYARIGRNHQTH